MTAHCHPEQYPGESALEAAHEAWCRVIDNERDRIPVMATLDDLAKMFLEFQKAASNER